MGKTEWGALETSRYIQGYPNNEVTVVGHNSKNKIYLNLHRKVNLPIEIWCACPSYDVQKETTQKKLEQYIPKHLIKHITYVKSGTWGEVLLVDGTKINFKSYEQGREKFQGAGKRLIWFDEEPPKDIWEECFVRSEAGIPLDIIMTMTPVNGMTWVYDEIYLDTSNEDLFVSEADWDDNPFLTEKQKAQMGRGLSPQAMEVRKKGKFVKKFGLVCPWWQRSTHCVDMTFNPEWHVGAALDFGFSNPACFGLIGFDYDDNINLFDGFYERQLTSPKLGEKIIKMCEVYGIKSMTIVADSAQAQSIQELNDYFTERELDFNVVGIRKIAGTDAANWDEYRADKMQQYGQVIDIDGKEYTKFHVNNKLMVYDEKVGKDVNWFVKEVEQLKWAEKASAIGKEKQQGDTWDVRFANHSIDMLSYWLVDHLEKAERPAAPKIGEGKLPGTYVRPSVEEEDEGDFVPAEEYVEDDNDFLEL